MAYNLHRIRTPAQRDASAHNYLFYRLCGVDAVLSRILLTHTTTDETREIVRDVERELNRLRLSMRTRRKIDRSNY